MARLSGLILKGGIDKTMLDLVRPVNSLYLTVGSEDPNTVFGGTWVKLTGGVLACAGTAGYAAAGAVGGSKKISVGQMPSHIHSGTRSITTTLKQNAEGGSNFALSGVVEDSLYTFDAWTNATGGGRTTTRSTSPSTSGRGRRSAGGFPWLRSSSAKARRSRSTAHSLSARAFSACTTPTRSGRARRGTSTARAITSSPQATPTRPTARTAPTRTRSQSKRCRDIRITLPLRRFGEATREHIETLQRQIPRFGVTETKTTPSRPLAMALPITTCRSQSRFRFGSGLNNEKHGEVIPHAA